MLCFLAPTCLLHMENSFACGWLITRAKLHSLELGMFVSAVYGERQSSKSETNKLNVHDASLKGNWKLSLCEC